MLITLFIVVIISCCTNLYIVDGFLPSTRVHNLQNSLSMSETIQKPKVNIPFENVLNVRDVASAFPTLQPGKVFRAGCVSNASEADIMFLHESMGMKSWIDLRSDKEHEEDEYLNSKVYNGFQSFHYDRKEKHFTTNDAEAPRKRFFISLMSESLIRNGVFTRLKKRNMLKVFLWAPIAAFSRRAYARMKSVFIKEINAGGLTLLNQLVVQSSGFAITAVLKTVAEEQNLPLALFCTAGKDRTGLVTMLILDICGVPDHSIVTDYEHSDSTYADMNNKRAMVASLSQSDLNPDTFLRAKGQVMRDTMAYIRSTFGSVNNFLDKYDFDHSWRERLRKALLK